MPAIAAPVQFFVIQLLLPNPDCASLHVDTQLPSMSLDLHNMPQDAGDEAIKLRDLLASIHGVTQAESGGWRNKYELSISKGTVFSWDEIKPRVEAAVSEFFADELKSA